MNSTSTILSVDVLKIYILLDKYNNVTYVIKMRGLYLSINSIRMSEEKSQFFKTPPLCTIYKRFRFIEIKLKQNHGQNLWKLGQPLLSRIAT